MRLYRGLTADGKWVYGWYIGIKTKKGIEDSIQADDGKRYMPFELVPNSVGQSTGLKDKNGLTEVYENDIIGVNGLVKGNKHENPSLLQDETNFVIPAITSKDWQKAYKEAMARGCKHAE